MSVVGTEMLLVEVFVNALVVVGGGLGCFMRILSSVQVKLRRNVWNPTYVTVEDPSCFLVLLRNTTTREKTLRFRGGAVLGR